MEVRVSNDEQGQLKQVANNIVLAFRNAQPLINFILEDERFTSVHQASIDELQMNLRRCSENFFGAGKTGAALGFSSEN